MPCLTASEINRAVPLAAGLNLFRSSQKTLVVSRQMVMTNSKQQILAKGTHWAIGYSTNGRGRRRYPPAPICGVSRILSGRLSQGDHLSHPAEAERSAKRNATITREFSVTRVGKRTNSLFCLAPQGVCLAIRITPDPVGSYPAISPLSRQGETVYFL
jgi:hypothetical protein